MVLTTAFSLFYLFLETPNKQWNIYLHTKRVRTIFKWRSHVDYILSLSLLHHSWFPIVFDFTYSESWCKLKHSTIYILFTLKFRFVYSNCTIIRHWIKNNIARKQNIIKLAFCWTIKISSLYLYLSVCTILHVIWVSENSAKYTLEIVFVSTVFN